MKATGISIYRLVIPVFVIAAVLACGLFAFDQYYLPQANRKQEALRNIIKGKPAQTTSILIRNGSSASSTPASRTGSSTTSSSIRTRTPSPTSASSNSTPRPLPSPSASSPARGLES
jgi:lipopolysaccharide export LptBFGC system permease protein LptF